MDLNEFETAVVARQESGDVLIALLDGHDDGRPRAHRCIGLFSCKPEVAMALGTSLGSALKSQQT